METVEFRWLELPFLEELEFELLELSKFKDDNVFCWRVRGPKGGRLPVGRNNAGRLDFDTDTESDPITLVVVVVSIRSPRQFDSLICKKSLLGRKEQVPPFEVLLSFLGRKKQ